MPDRSEVNQALNYLKQNILLNIGMIEPIRRGTAKLLYAGTDGVLLLEEKSGAYMISSDNEETAEKLLDKIEGADLFLAHQRFCVPMIEQRFGRKLQFDFLQAVYLKKDLIPVDESIEIRVLNEDFTQTVIEHYHTMDDTSYLKKLIAEGQMFGAFKSGGLAGFIGIHSEGSLGLLEVLPEYRRLGIGYVLEGFLINDMLEKGWIPFCQVLEDNVNSISLQKKLGLELSAEHLYWLF